MLGPLSNFRQLHPPDCRMDVGHAVIQANQLIRIPLFHTLVTQKTNVSCNRLIRCRHHATLTGCHVLRRIETESSKCSKCSNELTIKLSPVCLGRVFKEHKRVFVRERFQLIHRRRMTIEVNRHNGFRSLSDCIFNRSGTQTERIKINVSKNRRCSGEYNCIARCRESKRRNNNLVADADPRCKKTQMKRRSS